MADQPQLIHAFFVTTDDSADPTPVFESLGRVMLDLIWLRVNPSELVLRGQNTLRVDLFDLESGQPALTGELTRELSVGGRFALRVTSDGDATSYELCEDGKELRAGHGPANEVAETLAEHDLEWSVLAQAAAIEGPEIEIVDEDGNPAEPPEGTVAPDYSDIAGPGTGVLVRGRLLALPVGAPRWPELFHFHTRLDNPDDDDDDETDETDELAEQLDRIDDHVDYDDEDDDDDDDEEPDEDQLALVLLDRERADELWALPVSEVRSFLELIRPMARRVLGPLAHALHDEVLPKLAKAPADAIVSELDHDDATLYEVLSMATAVAYVIGDDLSYYDECFFPLLCMRGSEVSERAVADGLEDIEGAGVLAALTEVLPYSVPDGSMLESFDDREIAPLAHWAVKDDSYEGSLFLLDVERLEKQLVDFDAGAFSQRVERFHAAWHAAQNDGESLDEWLEGRVEIDRDELEMFTETIAELQLVLQLAAINELTPALLFYG
ncbi:MAG: hypothetical protein KC503_04350 [Myxococcales bacterium]|nr:hypothetical protein [Myxococcales bacterium]